MSELASSPASTAAIDELVRRHAESGGRLAAMAMGLPASPVLRSVVVTCMDSRIDVLALFGLELGEVHVLRNAGGVVTDDVVRSLTVSQRKLGTRNVVLVQHSECGMASFTDEEFAEELADEVGMRPPWRLHSFADPAVDVRRGMARLRREPFLLPGTVVGGFVLDGEFALTEIHPS